MKNVISKSNRQNKYILIIVISLYFLVSLSTLTDYPFVHSDESWLSGFTRTALSEGTFKTSEYFFTSYPRPIHGMKIVFTFLQALFIKLLGYNIWSVRLLSLIISTISLFLIGDYFVKKKSVLFGCLSILAIGSQIQFILMSHTARQEAVILFFFTLVWLLKEKSPILLGIIITLAIGVHPNSFLIASSVGIYYLYEIIRKERSIVDLIKFILVLAFGALFFIGISLYLNPNFFHDYFAYGQQLGIVSHNINRFQGFYYYYYKLFNQISGSYYLVDNRLVLLLLPIALLTLLRNNKTALFIIGINLGYFIIGRYNQTAIIFVIIFTIIALLESLTKIKHANLILIVVILIFTYQSYTAMDNQWNEPYQDLKEELECIPQDAKVLANLNLEYHFNYGQLHDYRNLWHIEDFKEYIKNEKIEYIVLYEEMTYIHNNPKWHILYGPLNYYPSMIEFLETCDLINSFENQTYGMRIARYVNDYPWYVKIYKVNPSNP